MYTRLEEAGVTRIKSSTCILFIFELISFALGAAVVSLNFHLSSIIGLAICAVVVNMIYVMAIVKFNQTENGNRNIVLAFILKSVHVAIDIGILIVLQHNITSFYLIMGKIGADAFILVIIVVLMPLGSGH